MPRWTDIAQNTAHRPWPLPDSPWLMTMSWVNLLAAHWPVSPELLADHIPAGLRLDTWEGDAWISVVPFEMDNVAPRGLTWWPKQMRFPELNVRTYVTADGEKPGVWFFNLEAASRLAVWGARKFFHLPYFRAEMSAELDGEEISYSSRRIHDGAPPAEFVATYAPTGSARQGDVGTFEHWIMERYCLYAARDSTLFRCDVQHEPWPLRPAQVQIETNTLFEALQLDVSSRPASAHYANAIDVVGWGLERIYTHRQSSTSSVSK